MVHNQIAGTAESTAKRTYPPLYPWYVHLVGGYVLTGFFPWLLITQQLWARNHRKFAIGVLCVNSAVICVIVWAAIRIGIPWWRLDASVRGFNLAWSLSAFFMQRRLYGPSEVRFDHRFWKNCLAPLAIACAIGSCITVALNILPVVTERFAAVYSEGASPRSLVLWEFFDRLPMGLLLGSLLGLWWAGEREFSISHVAAFFSGICLVALSMILFYALLAFVIHGGNKISMYMLTPEKWVLIPYGADGLRRLLINLNKFDYIAWVVVGLLFGTPGKIRVFLKRAAVIVPIIAVLTLSTLLYSQEGWQLIQGQIVYQLASPEPKHRHSAFRWLDVLLKRYPNHLQWPYLASRLADYHYERGDIDKARKTYREIVDRFSDSNQWKEITTRSNAILASARFGEAPHGTKLTVPLMNYQTHLTQNWMALLAVIRYWNGPEIPESDIAIRLMDISKSDDRIRLPKLTDLADLDDAARSLGYETLIMPSDPNTVRRLIENGIPVILPVFRTFYMLHGFDDARGLVEAYCFGQLSAKSKHRATSEAREILMVEAEGEGESEDRLKRIAHEARCQWPIIQWKSNAFRDAAPLMAVVYDKDRQSRIDLALGEKPESIKRKHKGYLAALIGLSFLNRGDPMACIQWARKGADLVESPLPYQVAHLGHIFWETRTRKIGTNIGLEEKFEILMGPVRFFNSRPIGGFILEARKRFLDDLKAEEVPWNIRCTLLSLLDRRDSNQRAQMIHLIQGGLKLHPGDKRQWHLLADFRELDGDLKGKAEALAGACSAGNWDARARLALAVTYVKNTNMEHVERLLKSIDPKKVAYEADYPFCLGAVAESKGKTKAALRHYSNAIDMCRYKPFYHLRYGKLLMDQGRSNTAEKALLWAARIDSGEKIRKEALNLLSSLR
jgi:tetratricopeptide (TPR) repeat protein